MTVRLHVDSTRLAEDHVVLVDEDHRYLSRVMRLTVGDPVVIFDGLGQEADAEVARVGPRATELRVGSRRQSAPRSGPELVLMQALARGEKLDFVVQKATELGVHRVVPMATDRAVLRLEEERATSRRARWQKIALEATRQCRRSDLPEIEPLTTFPLAVESSPRDALKLLFFEQAPVNSPSLRELLRTSPRPPAVRLAIGPEGGFTDEEVALARAAGFIVTSLGPRILRTETAGLAALAIVGYEIGDLGG